MRNRHRKLGRQIDTLTRGTPTERKTTVFKDTVVNESVKQLTIRKKPIMWGIPCDELGFSTFWITFMRHSNWMPWDGFAGSEGTYLPKARNVIHNTFLDYNMEYMMMLDSDILFPPDIADRLMVHNLPIVGGWYRDKVAKDHHPAVYDFVEEDEDGITHWVHRKFSGEGLEQVDGMGAGCWLMSRETAQALGQDPYDMISGGEDLVLSRKLMKLGIPLHVDWSINCAHVGVGHV